MYLMFLAVPTLPHESTQHRTLEALSRIRQRNQGSFNHLQVSTTFLERLARLTKLYLKRYNVLEDFFNHG